MAGDFAGAMYESSWMPPHRFDKIENQPEIGGDSLIGVARQLAKLDLRSVTA
jgi:hypothetical protein